MHDQMTRQRLYEVMYQARQELLRSLMFLSEHQATSIPVHADWSARDVISHIAARECTALAAVKHLAEEGRPTFGNPLDEREFNLGAIQRRKEFTLEDVVDELDGIRIQLSQLARTLPERDLFTRYEVGSTGTEQSVADVIAALAAHDYEHAIHLWQWRCRNGLLNRKGFRRFFAAPREAFLDALGGLREADMTGVAISGHWTTSQVMAHILSWDEEMLRTLRNWREDRTWQEGVLFDDEWNEDEVAARAHLTVVDLADGLATCHRQLLQHFDRASDEDLIAFSVAPWGERMSQLSFYCEMATHDATHVPELRALQNSRGR